MLLVGTIDHLEDLDRQYTVAGDVEVYAIAARPGVPQGMGAFALVDGARVVEVRGEDLAEVGRLPDGGAQSMAATGDGVLVGLRDARLVYMDVRAGTSAPVCAFDSVEGRGSWGNPAAPRPDLRSIAVTDAGSWLANVHVGGVWRSVDRGASWKNVVVPDDDVHEIVAGRAGTVVAAASRGFGWSTDDGATWQWTSDGLHAGYCRAVAVDEDRVFVTASTGPSTRDGRLFRARLGSRFEHCIEGLPESFPFNLDTGSLAARTREVALGTPDGQVFRSTDEGTTFCAVTERVGHVRVLRFV